MADKNTNIKGAIRNSVSQRLKDAASKWSPNTKPNIYQLSVFLMKSGYRLVDVLGENGTPELIIEAIKSDHLHPEILHDISEGEFFVKVEGRGLMIASELEEIMKGYTNALGVLKHLESLNLSKLEVDIKDKEDEE